MSDIFNISASFLQLLNLNDFNILCSTLIAIVLNCSSSENENVFYTFKIIYAGFSYKW